MAAVPSVGGTLGRYKIVEQIGQGGMGVVFRAFDTQLQRHVALKFTSPASDDARHKRFRTEALALARLNHPYIGVVHGFETIDGMDVLVMEHVSGKTLADHINGKPLPQSDVIRLGLQLTAALREAHASGVIHRDLKPNNIMITKDGDAKVLRTPTRSAR
jgi:serine/threonine protein kinase